MMLSTKVLKRPESKRSIMIYGILHTKDINYW